MSALVEGIVIGIAATLFAECLLILFLRYSSPKWSALDDDYDEYH